jgi:hypothetical protein
METIIAVYSITAIKLIIAIPLLLYLATALLDFVLYILEGPPCRNTWKKHSSTFTLASLLLRLVLVSNALLIVIILMMSLFN